MRWTRTERLVANACCITAEENCPTEVVYRWIASQAGALGD
jgi:hypothetical protein